MIVFIVHRSTDREKAHAHTCAKEVIILPEKISKIHSSKDASV